MAIVKKSYKDVTTGVRAVYQKGADMIGKRQLDYGIELLKQVVQKEPGFMDARNMLRAAEKEKSSSMSGFAKFIANIKSLRWILKAQAAAGKNPVEAMSYTEEALALNLYSTQALNLLATAAKNADAGFISSEALEILVDMDPENEANLRSAADLYQAVGDSRNLLKVWTRLANKNPDNLEFQGKLREAAARATMEAGKWDQEGSAAEKARAAKKDKKADVGDRIIRAEEDIKNMIAKFEDDIAHGNESVDLRRKLAELYMRSGRFEDSIKAYQFIVEKMGTLDPAIDRCIEKATVAIINRKIEELKAANAPEEEIRAQEQAILDYKLERYEDRVRLYPNDLVCRYELAVVYWDRNEVDKALEQFQLAQRNPAHRLQAMTYLGRCFHAKGQNDMAVEQFNNVLAEMPVMDKDKMSTLYYLGITYEDIGDGKNAIECFKQIYSANVNYLDVAKRMNDYYAKSKNS